MEMYEMSMIMISSSMEDMLVRDVRTRVLHLIKEVGWLVSRVYTNNEKVDWLVIGDIPKTRGDLLVIRVQLFESISRFI